MVYSLYTTVYYSLYTCPTVVYIVYTYHSYLQLTVPASDVVSFTSTAVPAAMVTARTEKVYSVNGCKFSTVTDVLVLGKLMVGAPSWSCSRDGK